MAYSQTPVMSTYETKDIPAVYDLDVPPGVDHYYFGSGMRNILPVKDANSTYGETRYCVSADVTSANASIMRGMYVWEKTIGTLYYFVVVSETGTSTSKVYSSTNGTSWTAVNTLGTNATTPVRFTEFINDTNTKKLVMVDGVDGYVFTSNAAGTKIVDADFPTPHVPFPVFIDGYLFLAKSGTGDIYNSDLNDPAIWTAGSFISSELYPDDIQAIAKVNNYLVAIGTQGCEYFYDAANAIASPLARIDSAALAFGTPFPNSIATSKDKLVFLANNNDGSVSLKYVEGTKATDIPCPFITYLNFVVGLGLNASSFRGMFFRHEDQLCYALAFKGDATVSNSNPYFVYSFTSQMWTEYVQSVNVGSLGTAVSFPVYFVASTTSNNLINYVAGHTAANSPFFGTLGPSSTYNFGAVRDTYNGGTTTSPIYQEIRTSIQDFDSINRKVLYRLGLNFTSSSTTSIDPSKFHLYWDDGTTFNYSSGNITFYHTNADMYDFPFVHQLGSFRRRTFKIAWSASSGTNNDIAFRWKSIELQLNRFVT